MSALQGNGGTSEGITIDGVLMEPLTAGINGVINGAIEQSPSKSSIGPSMVINNFAKINQSSMAIASMLPLTGGPPRDQCRHQCLITGILPTLPSTPAVATHPSCRCSPDRSPKGAQVMAHLRTRRPRKSAKHTRALQSRVIAGGLVKMAECRRGRLHIRLSPRQVDYESSQTTASIVNIERHGVLLVGPRVSWRQHCSMWTGAGCVRSGEHGLGSDSYCTHSNRGAEG